VTEESPTPPLPPARANRAVIIAFLIAGFALVAVSMLAQKLRNPVKRTAPAIRIIGGDTVTFANGATIRFVTTAPLVSSAHGWIAGDLHPHALIDQQMIMPMGTDIASVAADTFVLSLPHLDTGVHHLRLYWADGTHKAIGDSAHVILRVMQ
jgi:hypothetical protein